MREGYILILQMLKWKESNYHKVSETQYIFALKFYGHIKYMSLASECSRFDVLNSRI